MCLTDFFSINLPYGLERNSKNEWFVFNREYVPIGLNTNDNKDKLKKKLPIYTSYKGLTDDLIVKIIKNPDQIQKNNSGQISTVFFYLDDTNPHANPIYWDKYFYFIKEFSKFLRA